MEAQFLFLKKNTTFPFQLCLVHFDILLKIATKEGKKRERKKKNKGKKKEGEKKNNRKNVLDIALVNKIAHT